MQEITDLPFWQVMAAYGGADVYYTEYFRVHADSHLEKGILKSITHNPVSYTHLDVYKRQASTRMEVGHPVGATV